jgi:hypothetical protein
MAISRMQEPRQLYGLGSIVKKAVRGVKKIAKSPVGKAALIGGGLWGLSKFGIGGGIGNLLKTGAGKAFTWAKANPWQAGALGLTAAATALPFMMGGGDEEEEVEESWTQVPSSIADIRNQARAHYTTPASSTLSFMPDKQFVNTNFYAADGGRAGLMNGGEAGEEQLQQMLMAEFVKYKNQGGKLTFEQFVQAVMQAHQEQQMPEGEGMEQPQEVMMAANGGPVPGSTVPGYTTPAGHNRFDYYSGGEPVRVGKQEGGIMETEEASEMIDMGGQEKDYRETGGFVDLGGKERADDVPARLSKNEFVFTADAVRAAGGGDIDKGSEVMQNLMDNLEAGGEVSEDSQGLEGAQAMYDQQQMLQSRMI